MYGSLKISTRKIKHCKTETCKNNWCTRSLKAGYFFIFLFFIYLCIRMWFLSTCSFPMSSTGCWPCPVKTSFYLQHAISGSRALFKPQIQTEYFIIYSYSSAKSEYMHLHNTSTRKDDCTFLPAGKWKHRDKGHSFLGFPSATQAPGLSFFFCSHTFSLYLHNLSKEVDNIERLRNL